MPEHKKFYRIKIDSGGSFSVWEVRAKGPDRLKHVFTHRDDAVKYIKDLNGEELQNGQEGIR